MRSDCIALTALRPLVKRPGGLLDLALLLILAELADARGIVRSIPGQPITYTLLGALVARDGYHGLPASRPSRFALIRAVQRLEGIPGDPRFPRLLWADGTKGRDLIFQLALGRGKLRPAPTAAHAAAQGCKPAKPAKTRVSRSYPAPAAHAAAPLSINGSSIEENAREVPVDNVRAKVHLRKIGRVFRQRETDQK